MELISRKNSAPVPRPDVQIISEHIVEIVSDSGEGAQTGFEVEAAVVRRAVPAALAAAAAVTTLLQEQAATQELTCRLSAPYGSVLLTFQPATA